MTRQTASTCLRLGAALLLAWVAYTPADAQETGVDGTLEEGADSPSAKERARQLVDQGNELFKAKNFSEALAHYLQGYEAFASAKILFNIAEAHRELGHVLPALNFYRRFLEQTSPEPGSKIAEKAKERIAEQEAKVAVLVLVSELEGAVVSLDGVEVGRTPLPRMEVEPGRHTVLVGQVGYEAAQTVVEARAGSPIEVRLDPQPAAAVVLVATPDIPVESAPILSAAPEAVESKEGATVFSRWWFWTSLGAAVAVATTVVAVVATSGEDFTPSGELGRSGTNGWVSF